MTEKEFLKNFTKAYLDDYPGPEDITIAKFLEEHHKEYYEVEFVRKEKDICDINEITKILTPAINQLRKEIEEREE